jgi:hypothetical protein
LDSIKFAADSLWKSSWKSFIFVADIHKSIMETVSEDKLFDEIYMKGDTQNPELWKMSFKLNLLKNS